MPKLLYGLDINEVSSVDFGAGEGVQIALMKRLGVEEDPKLFDYMKRSFSASERKQAADRGTAMPDGSFPIEDEADLHNAIRAVGRANSPAKAKAHIKARAKSMGLESALPDDWTVAKALLEGLGLGAAVDALRKSVSSIFADDDVKDKDSFLTKTFSEFTKHIETSVPAAIDATGLTDDPNLGVITKVETMTDKELQAAIDTAVTKALATPTATIAKLQDDLAIASLSEVEKKYTVRKGMDAAAVLVFAKASADDKKKQMAADAEDKAEGDEQTAKSMGLSLAEWDALTPSVRKSLRATAVSKADDIKKKADDAEREKEDMRKRLDAVEKADRLTAFTKRAVDIGLPDNFGQTLMDMHEGDATLRKTAAGKLEDLLKSAYAQVEAAGLMRELGTGQGNNLDDPYAALLAKAEELRKSASGKDLSQAQAFEKVYGDPANKDLVLKYKQSTAPRLVAANR